MRGSFSKRCRTESAEENRDEAKSKTDQTRNMAIASEQHSAPCKHIDISPEETKTTLPACPSWRLWPPVIPDLSNTRSWSSLMETSCIESPVNPAREQHSRSTCPSSARWKKSPLKKRLPTLRLQAPRLCSWSRTTRLFWSWARPFWSNRATRSCQQAPRMRPLPWLIRSRVEPQKAALAAPGPGEPGEGQNLDPDHSPRLGAIRSRLSSIALFCSSS